MKIGKLSLLMILGVVLFTSCNNDDESTQSESLNGTWNVENISGGFAGIDDDYETGIITWTFNNQILIVENNSSPGNIYTGFESGTYNYSTTVINENDYIIINNVEYGIYTLSVDNLIINQNISPPESNYDGFILQFKR